MDWLKFERIAGEGVDALYNLYADGQIVGTALTMDEVLAKITEAEEENPNGHAESV